MLARGRTLLLLAIATSIDAAAAGLTLPLLDQPVSFACTIIGLVAFFAAVSGVMLGRMVGTLLGKRAELLGGVILLGIGAKILITHLLYQQ